MRWGDSVLFRNSARGGDPSISRLFHPPGFVLRGGSSERSGARGSGCRPILRASFPVSHGADNLDQSPEFHTRSKMKMALYPHDRRATPAPPEKVWRGAESVAHSISKYIRWRRKESPASAPSRAPVRDSC